MLKSKKVLQGRGVLKACMERALIVTEDDVGSSAQDTAKFEAYIARANAAR